jgi:hypothetical protein
MKTLTLPFSIGAAIVALVIVGTFAVSQSLQSNQMMENDHSVMMEEHEEMSEICEEHAEKMEEECEEHMLEHEEECQEMMEECEERMHEHEEEHMEEVEHEEDIHDSLCRMMGGNHR